MQSKKVKKILALIAMTLMLSAATAVPAQTGKTRRIRFARGRTSTILKGSVVRGTRDNYILGASAGQSMYVHLTSREKNASFTIYVPGKSDVIAGATDVTDWEGSLPFSGDWVIEVGPTRGNATYTLEVTIR
jgi:hypothetical protein